MGGRCRGRALPQGQPRAIRGRSKQEERSTPGAALGDQGEVEAGGEIYPRGSFKLSGGGRCRGSVGIRAV